MGGAIKPIERDAACATIPYRSLTLRPPATWMFKGASETTDTLVVRQTVGEGGGFTMLNRGRKQHLANTQNGLKSLCGIFSTAAQPL